MFGEMLGLWTLTEWLGQGRRKEGVVLVELGPGRGTLMADVLRTLGAFPEMRSAVEKVVLLEASKGLRETQARVLCGDGGLRRTEDGNGWWGKAREELGGGTVEWYEDWELVPKGRDIPPPTHKPAALNITANFCGILCPPFGPAITSTSYNI